MSGISASEFAERAADVEWILCDVDGVLTDGGLYYDRRGHAMLRFDVRDGLGLELARRAGLKTGVLSGRAAAALDHRASELGFDAVMSGVRDKLAALEQFLEERGVSARQVAFVGDDLPDLVALARCGLTFAPANAAPEVRTVVHRVLEARGGAGAVREMVEAILQARGDWEAVFRPFTFDR
ncbi:MAG: HAD hydrolase family protein [Acidobacteriota bacterium]|nr:HAD hydrolase family protein [Acidobacteriota bacterium]MDH3524734.1 HAD hydrolase family protein [Acidobacteriota bacterium]